VVGLIVDKNRGGPAGKVAVVFFPSFTLFENAADEDHARAERDA
jgi:replicative DNA helicase